MQDFEKLGVFYLGRQYDLAQKKPQEELLFYDAKDLTTHAVCVGMTGSGKTGLCLALLEEAAIDGIPAIAIDPKGDLSNLLLTFPQLRPEDFRPWVDEAEATRKGITPDELAANTAKQWREGLAEWGEDGARIERFRQAVDIAIYTPGSSAGLPLAVLRSFAAPPAAVMQDADSLRQQLGTAVSGLLALVGIEADPIQSREHILLSQLIESAWRQGQGMDLGALIHGIQSPPFERVGYVDLETFYPAKQRFELSMKLNNLLASPGFAAWMEGEPLDIGRLLHTPEGKPRLSILSIAHLSDAERMFFVTLLLGEVLAWTRSQSGTSSLRAILYMDEVFGYFPPSANPPSKTPMLTLLKQARAYGLGIVLATQNPVDLDYKGLSNAGTWFLGRLQTERDKARVLDGLEGASAAASAKFDRGEIEKTLSALGNRVFLMNNVHDDHPVVFQSRWCLSYLRGPLSRGQIQTLMAERKQQQPAPAVVTPGAASPIAGSAPANAAAGASFAGQRPLVPAEAGECFVPPKGRGGPAKYVPGLLGAARLHFVDAKAGIDQFQDMAVLALAADEDVDEVWAKAEVLPDGEPAAESQPENGASFAPLPAALSRPKNYARWAKSLAAHLYANQSLQLWYSPLAKEYSRPGESEGDFRVRIDVSLREQRDASVEKLRQKYASKITTLDNQIRRAQNAVAREKEQFTGQVWQTVTSLGTSILGALVGRKLASRTNVTGAASAARAASRAAQQHSDIGRAAGEVEALEAKKAELAAQVQSEIDALEAANRQAPLESYAVRPKKTDIAVRKVVLAWVGQ